LYIIRFDINLYEVYLFRDIYVVQKCSFMQKIKIRFNHKHDLAQLRQFNLGWKMTKTLDPLQSLCYSFLRNLTAKLDWLKDTNKSNEIKQSSLLGYALMASALITLTS